MTASFTPGPWKWGSLTTKAGRSKIAMENSKHRMFDMSVFNDEDLANARLIAAAPDLYEALKALTDCYGVGYKSADDLARALSGYMTDARAILAKVQS